MQPILLHVFGEITSLLWLGFFFSFGISFLIYSRLLMFSDVFFFFLNTAFRTCFGAVSLRTFTVKSSLLPFPFSSIFCLFILVAIFHKTVVLTYLVVLDRPW